MNINFIKKLIEYFSPQGASGEYQNNSEVIRGALRFHGIYREKVIKDVRREIEFGLDGPYIPVTMDQIIESKKKS
ncbi:MAG: type II toxin-antitoxin system ParD family antitoxin [Gillisia sp.]